jgi:nitrogen regulatory protein P-II 1
MSSLPSRSPNAPRTDESQVREKRHVQGARRALKRVEVVTSPVKLDEIKEALAEAGISGMTVSEARVFGPAARRHEVYLGSSYVVDFARKVKIEIMVRDDVVPDIIEVVRIRTGDPRRRGDHVSPFLGPLGGG